jgi:DHA1 family bicyclomycin/chloramphenicol resistance-like MFS transporter
VAGSLFTGDAVVTAGVMAVATAAAAPLAFLRPRTATGGQPPSRPDAMTGTS